MGHTAQRPTRDHLGDWGSECSCGETFWGLSLKQVTRAILRHMKVHQGQGKEPNR